MKKLSVEKDKTILLCIETATENCSVAIGENTQILALKEEEGRSHAKNITLFIDAVMNESNLSMEDLDAVVLSQGPGSYTSLRVGMSAAKAICYGLDIPMIAIPTLEALILAAEEDAPGYDAYSSMIDARRMEVYASLRNRNKELEIEDKAIIIDEESLRSYTGSNKKILLCGNGAPKVKSLYPEENVHLSELNLSASFLLKPGLEKFKQREFVDTAYFSPNYIKSPNITKAKKKLL